LKTLDPRGKERKLRKSRRTDRFVFFLLRAQAALLNFLVRDDDDEEEDSERIFFGGFMDCDNNNRPGVEHGKSFFLGNGTMVMCFFVWFRY
jgi:hypothetical protein